MYRGRVGQLLWETRKRFAARAGQAPKHVIFVAGFQRSGTNMIMGGFDRHSQVQVYHEADARAYDDYSLRPNPIIERLVARSFAPNVALKTLLDADRLSELMALFPGSGALWPVRHYDDVINSHLRSWPGFREHVDAIVAGEGDDTWRGRNIARETLDKVRAAYGPDASVADCKGLMYAIRSELAFSQGLSERDDVMMFEYERLAAAPEAGFRNLSAFAGLAYEPAMSAHIHARSIAKRAPPALSEPVRRLCDDVYQRLCAICRPIEAPRSAP